MNDQDKKELHDIQATLMWQMRQLRHEEKGVIIAGMLAGWIAPMPREAHREAFRTIIRGAKALIRHYQKIIKERHPHVPL